MPDEKGDPRFQPVSAFDLPRFAGVPTFMRLPYVPLDDGRLDDVVVGLVGVPFDGGTTNRPGARHGPRGMRDASTQIRLMHAVSELNPFAAINCADLGDVGPNPASVDDSLARITAFYERVVAAKVTPLTAGGDHLISLPILRALAKDGPLGMIQFDAHTDLWDNYFGGMKFTHGTPFRRAIEEGLLDPKRVVQIGIRGTMSNDEDRVFAEETGVTLIKIEELFEIGVTAAMAKARAIVGDAPTYVSFDIDFVDPAYAPGTGTLEIGGPTSFQALQAVRGLEGVRIIGADLVEVSPPLDQTGGTSWLGASLLFEILCVMAGNIMRRRETS